MKKNPLFMTTGSFRLGIRPTARRILISNTHNFVCYRIPKVASSTILKTLVEMDPCLDLSHSYDDAKAKTETYYHPYDLGLIESLSAKLHFFSFAFVRNPFDRLLSAYLDKMREGHNKTGKVCARVPLKDNSKPSFDEFVFYLEKKGIHDDIHWAPQVTLIPKRKNLSFRGKFENLESDLKEVTSILFPDSPYKGPVDSRSHATGASEKRSEYYSSDLKRKVETLYRKDLKEFGYGWDD